MELGQVGTGQGRNLTVDLGGHGGDNAVTLGFEGIRFMDGRING